MNNQGRSAKYYAHKKANLDAMSDIEIILLNKELSSSPRTISLDFKDSIDEPDNYGSAKLHYAASRGDLASMTALINIGANIDIKDQYGFTPLIIAANLNQIEAMNFLIENKANIEILDNNGMNAL